MLNGVLLSFTFRSISCLSYDIILISFILILFEFRSSSPPNLSFWNAPNSRLAPAQTRNPQCGTAVKSRSIHRNERLTSRQLSSALSDQLKIAVHRVRHHEAQFASPQLVASQLKSPQWTHSSSASPAKSRANLSKDSNRKQLNPFRQQEIASHQNHRSLINRASPFRVIQTKSK